MKIFKRIRNSDNVETNSWTDENGLDENYTEPSFGDPSTYSVSIEDVGDAEQWAKLRQERNLLLSECDWTQLADCPLSSEQKNSWASYRQELRDLPDNCEDVYSPTWPIKPS